MEQGAHCASVFTTDLDKVPFGSQGSNVGQFQSLQAVAVDKDDNIYITDSGNHRVQKFTSNGRFIGVVDSKHRYSDITIVSVDHVYHECSDFDWTENCGVEVGRFQSKPLLQHGKGIFAIFTNSD